MEEKTELTNIPAGITNDAPTDNSVRVIQVNVTSSSGDGEWGKIQEDKNHNCLKSWFKSIKNDFASTFSKRNPLANALLSIYLIGYIILAILIALFALLALFGNAGFLYFWATGIPEIFYSFFCVYFTWQFIVSNKKCAVKYAFLGSITLWFAIMFWVIVFNTPNFTFDEDGNEIVESDFSLAQKALFASVIINIIAFGLIRMIMMLRKYGASAWQLLDVYRKKSLPKFEKTLLILFCTLWGLPVINHFYEEYRASHPKEKYPSHVTAKIGDYYYEDGTVSSDLLNDKIPVGIVYSLETTEREKMMGFNHGQIISLTDLYAYKVPWDTELRDCENYPNYTWSNRIEALEDINGYNYTSFEGNSCLTINWDSMNFKKREVNGISNWYVPTAGQWSLILQNLGGVTVDRMLKFDSTTASQNLENININPQRWYWTITEFDAENAWSIRLANGEFGSRSNKQNGAYVRPVASF